MAEAENALQRHAEAINDRDLAAYRETMNYPFTYQNYNGVALTIADAAEVGVSAKPPWEIILETDPDWLRTEFDQVEEVAQSQSSAVFKVHFRRLDTSGRDDGSYQAIWIVTCQGGYWGVQFRHNLGQVTSV
ncbi:MAG: hypothetical protein AAF346_04385 [Pseudomonadota bacterium]